MTPRFRFEPRFPARLPASLAAALLAGCAASDRAATTRTVEASRSVGRSTESITPEAPADPVAELLARFRAHDLVLLGESPHQGRRIHAFYERLLDDPAFPAQVDDVLVEFGSARHQALMDRYLLELEDVPVERLAVAWRDTTQLLVWDSPLYEDFFRHVRRINQGLARGERVRVLLGDPPIEWENVHVPEDLERWYDRESSCLSILEHEVLARHRKALVLIGSTHLLERNPTAGFAAESSARDWLGQRLAARHPGRSVGVYPFFGRAPLSGFEGVAAWTPPTLVDLTTSPIGAASFGLIAPLLAVRREVEGETVWAPLAADEWPSMCVMVDALLYLGEEAEDEEVPASPEIYREPAYATELRRRAALLDAYFGFDSYVPSLTELQGGG